jgi:hypothetical protein
MHVQSVTVTFAEPQSQNITVNLAEPHEFVLTQQFAESSAFTNSQYNPNRAHKFKLPNKANNNTRSDQAFRGLFALSLSVEGSSLDRYLRRPKSRD